MKKIFTLLFIGSFLCSSGQTAFSLSTDVSYLRNISPQQKFGALGQTVKGNFHFTPKQAAYVWLSYYGKGNLSFNETTSAKSPLTSPRDIDYTVKSVFRYQQISMGLQHYFKGTFESEGWNLYGYAGFGLLSGRVQNTFNPTFDSTKYEVNAPLPGLGKFKKLTFDLAIGTEYPVTTGVYVYSEVRGLMAASDFPSDYLRNNKNVPSIIAFNMGIRVLFY